MDRFCTHDVIMRLVWSAKWFCGFYCNWRQLSALLFFLRPLALGKPSSVAGGASFGRMLGPSQTPESQLSWVLDAVRVWLAIYQN